MGKILYYLYQSYILLKRDTFAQRGLDMIYDPVNHHARHRDGEKEKINMEERPMSADREQAQNQIVVFTLDKPRCALLLSAMERVVHAVEITPLPKAPEIVQGVINAQGRIIPVIDVRKRFRLPEREIRLDDQFIIARTSRRLVALVVDSVVGIREVADWEMVDARQSLPFAEYLQGVAKIEDNIILIYDLDQFLSLDEERLLDAAMSGGAE